MICHRASIRDRARERPRAGEGAQAGIMRHCWWRRSWPWAGWVLAQSAQTTVATSPLLVDQADQKVRGGAGEFLQRGPHRLGDQFQPGPVRCRSQDMRGIGALHGAFTHEPTSVRRADARASRRPASCDGSQGRPVQGQGIFEIDAAIHRLGGLTVRQIEQELQHTDSDRQGG